MSNERLSLGRSGEEKAAKFLKRLGFKILRRNYRCRLGEIDIIAKDRNELVFVEVKTRSSASHGLPAQAVNKRKQGQIIKAAQTFLMETSLHDHPARFDVVAIQVGREEKTEINHIRNAFEL